MKTKFFYIKEKKNLNSKQYYFIIDNQNIKCVGGEGMQKEKPELIFLNNDEIPKAFKGKTGRKWKQLFEQIPEGKTLIIPEEYGTNATIRGAVKNVNEQLGKETFKAFQRTIEEKITMYVQRL